MSNRWQHLVNAAFAIDEARASRRAVDTAKLRTQIDNALELFPASLDPVEDFEAFAVRRMLLAISRALEPAD